MRVQPSEAVPRIVPIAERLGLQMGIEIHTPWLIEETSELIEHVDPVDSPALGFIPDYGTFCYSPARVFLDRFLELGVPERIVSEVTGAWHVRTPADDVRARVQELGGDELAQLLVTESIVHFGYSDPRSMLQITPRIIHVHGRFFDINADGTDGAVRFPEVVEVLQEGDYDGIMSCDYGSHHWSRGRDAVAQIKPLQEFILNRVDG
jgi:hypothetical protein